MRTWRYVEPASDVDLTPVYYTFTDDEIVAMYWDYWSEQMRRAGKLLMVTREHCIMDWVVVNWAWEV